MVNLRVLRGFAECCVLRTGLSEGAQRLPSYWELVKREPWGTTGLPEGPNTCSYIRFCSYLEPLAGRGTSLIFTLAYQSVWSSEPRTREVQTFLLLGVYVMSCWLLTLLHECPERTEEKETVSSECLRQAADELTTNNTNTHTLACRCSLAYG